MKKTPHISITFQPCHKEGPESSEEGSEGDVALRDETAEGTEVKQRYKGLREYQSQINKRFRELCLFLTL